MRRYGRGQEHSRIGRIRAAFVKASSGITVMNHIYGTSDSSVYVVTQKTPDSGQMLGTYIYQSSAISGLRIGDINGNNPNSKSNSVKFNPVGGDSGSPLFLGSGFTANLYGITYAAAPPYTLYYPQDYVQTRIGAVASTS